VKEFRKHNLTYDQARYVFKSARRVLSLKSPKRKPTVVKSLSEQQVEKFFSVISDPQDLILFRIVYSCALRVSGLCDLKKENVCLDTCSITVEFNKTNGGRIPFPAALKPLLQMHLAATPNNTFLFESNRKTKFSTRTVQLKFKQYMKLAKLPESYAIHCLRHSCLMHLAAKSFTQSELQSISLHRDAQSLNSYVNLSLEQVQGKYQAAMR